MKYNLYFRKTSFKKDIKNAEKLLSIVNICKPKNFLEVGVLEGVTSRNICELLYTFHSDDFKFIGIDLFGMDKDLNNNKEFTPLSNKYSNPFKNLYFNYILKEDPNSINAVKKLLKKFEKSVSLYRGYSEEILKKIDIAKFDFVFLDGGHSYPTVKSDLKILLNNMKKNSIILCDDYNINHYGVKRAVDELKHKYQFEDMGRFAFIKI
ncbi:class I SAM-dependent methyltransferase [Pelagibacteraceae bacterium]|nr:class I SAM-dependent methyltransferase [Pelagibacteraceae bacterium]